MKISKVFGFVLCLHLGIIAVLIVQPGCGTTQPPTQMYQQNRTTGVAVQELSESLIPESGLDASIDSAFNAGFDASADGRYAPNRPDMEFAEFEEVTPQLEPVESTIDVAGPSFQSYTIEKGDSLWAISRRYNVSLNELYTANDLNDNSVLKIGQQIQIPVEGGTATVTTVAADAYQPSSYNMATETYTVKGGDNLSKIAANYNTSVRALKAANNKTSDLIRVGEQLMLPVTGTASGGSTAPVAAAESVGVTSADGTHIVKAGEYPATIARQYGMTASELLSMNGITDPRKMQIGQVLKVSSATTVANVAANTTTVAVVESTVAASSDGSIEIRVVEADPLVEEDFIEMNTDDLFENAEEIPVVRMNDQ